jgi:putative phage-type endonuclease
MGLDLDKLRVGGTDVAAILGIYGFKTFGDSPLNVYLRLRGEAAPEEPGFPSEEAEWGTLLEPTVAEKYARAHEAVLYCPGEMRHREIPWMCGKPDRLVLDPLHGLVAYKGLEVKTAGLRMAAKWGDPGTQEIPESYLLQVIWYMMVTQLPLWDVAVLIGGQSYREYAFSKDEELEATIFARVESFLTDNVLAGKPPDPDGSEQSANAIRALFPKSRNEGILAASQEQVAHLAGYRDARERKEEAEQSEEFHKQQIQMFIGQNRGLEAPGFARVSWTNNKDGSRIDWQQAFMDFLAINDTKLEAEHVQKIVKGQTSPVPGARVFRVRWLEE